MWTCEECERVNWDSAVACRRCSTPISSGQAAIVKARFERERGLPGAQPRDPPSAPSVFRLIAFAPFALLGAAVCKLLMMAVFFGVHRIFAVDPTATWFKWASILLINAMAGGAFMWSGLSVGTKRSRLVAVILWMGSLGYAVVVAVYGFDWSQPFESVAGSLAIVWGTMIAWSKRDEIEEF